MPTPADISRRSEPRDRAQQYLDIAEVLLVAIDTQERITLINRKGCQILGYRQDELVGRNWFDTCLPQAERRRVRTVFAKLMAGKTRPLEYFENPVLTRGGGVRIISWHNAVLRNARGVVVGCLSSGEDITDRKRLQEQLLQAHKMESIGTMSSGIAHDFGNIMAVIATNVSVLEREPELSDKARQMLADIARAAEQGSAFTRQLLAYARGSSPKSTRMNLNRAVALVGLLLTKTAPRGIRLGLCLKEPLPLIIADPTQIEQVVMNLCLNAIQASRAPSRIEIITEVEELKPTAATDLELLAGTYVRLQVKDQGCGMDEQTARRIFDPFFTTKPTGRGMGLATTLGIVRGHHGQVRVDTAPGKGTTISVWLPVAEKRSSIPSPHRRPYLPVRAGDKATTTRAKHRHTFR